MNTPPPPPPAPELPVGVDGWPEATAWTEDAAGANLVPARIEKCPELPKKARVI